MSLLSNLRARGRRGLTAAAVVALLSACGGGTSQYEPFLPERMLVFGDEYSYLTPAGFPGETWGTDGSGRKFGVNVFNPADATSRPGLLNCENEPLWFQAVASQYGFTFAECDPTPDTTADRKGFIYAQPFARVAEVKAQVEAVPAAQWGNLVMTTVLAGVHDIVDIYENRGSKSRDALLADAAARGKELGQLSYPYGVLACSSGGMLVAEFGNNRIQRLDASGRGVWVRGGGGGETGRLVAPWAVVGDASAPLVVDAGNCRLVRVRLPADGER